MTLPRVADSLAGRIETIRMLPLVGAEIVDTAPPFLARMFSEVPKLVAASDLQCRCHVCGRDSVAEME